MAALVPTRLPRIAWTSDEVVTVYPHRGEYGSLSVVAFSDGIARYFDTSLTVRNDLAAGPGSLDLVPVAAANWYYIYLVPKIGDDTQCSAIGSRELPTAGPFNDGLGVTRYATWRYIGVVWVDSGSDWAVFDCSGPMFRRMNYQDHVVVFKDNLTNSGVWHTWTISNVMAPIYVMRGILISHNMNPGTVSARGFVAHMDATVNYDSGTTYTVNAISYQGTIRNEASGRAWLWMNEEDTQIWVRTDNAYEHGSNQGHVVTIEGWYDKYLIP